MNDDIDIDRLVGDYLRGTTELERAQHQLAMVQRRIAAESGEHSKLYVSDLGGCARQVAYRVLGAEMTPFEDTKVAMFDSGNRIHDRTNLALAWAGLRAYDEYRLSDYLPGDWGGRLDVGRTLPNGKVRLIDWKTQNPNGMRRTKYGPKEKDVLQVSTYFHWWPRPDELDGLVEVGYLDRGGSNQSQLHAVEPVAKQTILEEMERIAVAVEAAEHSEGTEMPACPASSIRWNPDPPRETKAGVTGDLTYGPPWNCLYCRVRICPSPREVQTIAYRRATKAKNEDGWFRHGRGWLNLNAQGRTMRAEVRAFLESEAQGDSWHEFDDESEVA